MKAKVLLSKILVLFVRVLIVKYDTMLSYLI